MVSSALSKMLSHGPVLAPFVSDGLQAKMAEKAGFEAIYLTGFGTAAGLGLPDIGLTSFGEMLDNIRSVTGAVDIPVICDADTGYGNPLNVIRLVREYERAGVSAFHIEDQLWPKRCGYMEGKAVIAADEMVQKIRAAVDARKSEIKVVARTDALQSHGWDEAERRVRLYREEGADLIFVDGVSAGDVEEYDRRVGDMPVLFNNGPQIPMDDVLGNYNFNLIIHPGTFMCAVKSFSDALLQLQSGGKVDGVDLHSALRLAMDALDAEKYFNLSNKYALD